MAQLSWGAPTNSSWNTEKSPLPEDRAFQVEAIKTSEGALVRMTPAEGYYIYQDKTRFNDVDGSAFVAQWPPGEEHNDPHFGLTIIHRHQVEVLISLRPAFYGPIEVSFQGCQDKGICYPPMDRTLELASATADQTPPALLSPSITAKELAQDEQWFSSLETKPTWWLLGAFLLGGLALAFTPCVLPMVPVVLGLVAPEQKGRKAFTLALVYVLSHSLVLAAAGVAGAVLGGGAGLIQMAQQPFILIGAAAVLIALGAWQAGWIRISLGGRMGTWVHNTTANLPKGRLSGAIALGAGSALILGPCVAPLIAGVLIFVTQNGSPLLGGSALFMMGLGMGVPLLAIAAGAGYLVPKTSVWMTHLSLIAASGFFAVAAILLDRATGQQSTLWWGLCWAVVSVSLWMPGKAELRGVFPIAGIILAIAMATLTIDQKSEAHPQGLVFETVSAEELQQRLAQGERVIVDLSADWCSSCLTMEKTTFADKRVAMAAEAFQTLRLNLDEINDAEQSFLKTYGLIGPPAVLFFDAQGQEIRQARLVGPEDAIAFTQRLNRLSSLASEAAAGPLNEG